MGYFKIFVVEMLQIQLYVNPTGYRICHIDTTAAKNCYNVAASKERW
jgi:hypothetical protein